ncbi:FtsK/SpoIIIE domain-containing protein [Paenibacillus sp. JTLBN-2024]
MVASLAAEFHPHDLAFMLIDYKGGGMSNTFVDLPHVVGTITNLSTGSWNGEGFAQSGAGQTAENIERCRKPAAHRRILQLPETRWRPAAPAFGDHYRRVRELKKDQPELMDELISIAAIGRTLGVHSDPGDPETAASLTINMEQRAFPHLPARAGRRRQPRYA